MRPCQGVPLIEADDSDARSRDTSQNAARRPKVVGLTLGGVRA